MQVRVYRQGKRVRPSVEGLVTQRLQTDLGRFARRVSQIDVALNKVNGERDGRGRHCRMHVRLAPRGVILAEATEDRFVVAIGRCTQRITRQIRKRWERIRRLKRHVLRPRAA